MKVRLISNYRTKFVKQWPTNDQRFAAPGATLCAWVFA